MTFESAFTPCYTGENWWEGKIFKYLPILWENPWTIEKSHYCEVEVIRTLHKDNNFHCLFVLVNWCLGTVEKLRISVYASSAIYMKRKNGGCNVCSLLKNWKKLIELILSMSFVISTLSFNIRRIQCMLLWSHGQKILHTASYIISLSFSVC